MTRLPRSLRRRLLTALVVAGVLGLVLHLIGSLQHHPAVSAALVLLTGVALALGPWLLDDVGRYADRAYWSSTPRQETAAPVALDYRLVRIRRDLRDAVERDDRPDSAHATIRELTAERLLNLHGIDLDTDPEAAGALLTPGLRAYLSTDPTERRRRSAAMLRTAIEGIEKL